VSLFAFLSRRARDEPADERWVVVDTETSGLDPDADDVLGIGAVAVDAGGIRPGDSFECVLFHDAPTHRENVVVHGIGHAAQRGGEPRRDALAAFLAYVGEAPCVAFHAEFDRRILARAFVAAELGPAAGMRWLDVAPLASALSPEATRKGARSLDDWLERYAIDVAGRHSAAGDALATAELLLRLRAMARAQGAIGFDALARVARQQKWLGHAG